MAELLKCMECGKSVSSALSKCPHCGTESFGGATCGICQKIAKKSELIPFSYFVRYKYSHSDKRSYGLCHKSCADARTMDSIVFVEEEIIVCPICSTSNVIKEHTHNIEFHGYYSKHNCFKCGHILEKTNFKSLIAKCFVCNNHVAIKKAKVFNYLGYSYYAHSICCTEEQKNSFFADRKAENEEKIIGEKRIKELKESEENKKMRAEAQAYLYTCAKISAVISCLSIILRSSPLFILGVIACIVTFIIGSFMS